MTEPFVSTANTLAAVLGLSDYPLCVVPHPISSDDPAALRDKAFAAARRAAAILTDGAGPP